MSVFGVVEQSVSATFTKKLLKLSAISSNDSPKHHLVIYLADWRCCCYDPFNTLKSR